MWFMASEGEDMKKITVLCFGVLEMAGKNIKGIQNM
jgi:hypothetical protein